MKNSQLWFAIVVFISAVAEAAEIPSPAGQTNFQLKSNSRPTWTQPFGLSYFTFFDGPGLAPGQTVYTPNALGKPSDDGLRLNNFISIKYKFSPSLAFDFQMRLQWVLNNPNQVNGFSSFRWQSPRFGISGKLFAGEDWSLVGAINTDFPYFIPRPFGGGVVARQRTTLFNPGLFAKFNYKPKGSPWSVFSLVMPRFFFYADREAAEPQLSRAGLSPMLKNEFILDIAPSVNYAFSRTTGVRFGTEFTYSKLILSSWNPFHASLNHSNLNSDAWRLAPVPIQIGLTHELSEAFSVSGFIQGYPIAAQRERRDGSRANFMDTVSVGMWINGTVI